MRRSRCRILNWNKYAEKYKDILTKLFRYQSVPYSVIVQTYSNLHFKVNAQQNSNVAGARVSMYATLKQYNLPISASVNVEISFPNGSRMTTALQETSKGNFEGSFLSTISGVYALRYKANGFSLSGKRFTRETLRSISLYKSEPVIPTGNKDKDNNKICEIMECFLSQKGVQEYLRRFNVDADSLKNCLKSHCMDRERNSTSPLKNESGFTEAEVKIMNKLQSLASFENISKLITSVPKMEDVPFSTPEIPKLSIEHLRMPVAPAIRVTGAGEVEVVKMKHGDDKHNYDDQKDEHHKHDDRKPDDKPQEDKHEH